MKRSIALISLALILSSHELFLKTDNHFLKPNTKAELYLFNGTFDKSENVITRDRIINDKVIGPKFMLQPKSSAYYDKDNVTYLKLKTGGAGTYIAGVSTLPRMIELTSQEFMEYLEHEGLTGVLEDRDKRGVSNLSAKERYSKHVKSILQVGDSFTGQYKVDLEYPIEFIPLENPYQKELGDELSFKLLRDGKPIPNQVVHYSSRTGSDQTQGEENITRTNDEGVVSIVLDNPGQWYLATIHMVLSPERGIDYESNWATITFEVKK